MSLKRKIPATMVSQHPDHASVPYWKIKIATGSANPRNDDGGAFISTAEETRELFLSFSDLGVSEYKWDWEGKLVDESVMERLLSDYYDFFKDNPIGQEKFLTFRLPNPQVETEFRLGRAFMNLISAAAMAAQFKLPDTPLFEVILPMTTSPGEMMEIHEAFNEIAGLKHKLYRMEKVPLKSIKVIPLFEDIDTIANSGKILEDYIKAYGSRFGRLPIYIRPYVARSDPALNSGMVPTVLAIKLALSDYAAFSEKYNIPTYPIIGSASLSFRGGLTPETVDSFTNEYRGVRTALLQSAFRYDYPKKEVIAAIKRLESLLPRGIAERVSVSERAVILEMMKIFESFYKPTIEGIADIINQIATDLPKRRERVQHVGLFGYSRGMGKVRLPRAIGFTAALYSIGVPPELIGTGRGLRSVIPAKAGIQADSSGSQIKFGMTVLEKYYLNIRQDLKRAGAYLNKKNLRALALKSKFFKGIEEDVLEIEKYLGEKLEPKTRDELEHQKISTKILQALNSKKSTKDLVEKSALLRKSLG
jgi:phosphoenolpyruvate carboxylase